MSSNKINKTITYEGFEITMAHPKMSVADFINMKKQREICASAKFPLDGEVLRTKIYPVHAAPEVPVQNGNTVAETNSFNSRARVYEAQLKVFDELTRKQTAAKLQIYNLVYSTLSDASIDVLSRDPTWDRIDSTRDVIGLMNLIDATHASGCTSSNPLHRYNNAMALFESFEIGANETIAAYTQRLNIVISGLALNNIPRIITDNEKAWKWYRGLERSTIYKPFVDYIEMETASKPDFFSNMTFNAMKDALTKIKIADAPTFKGNRSAFAVSSRNNDRGNSNYQSGNKNYKNFKTDIPVNNFAFAKKSVDAKPSKPIAQNSSKPAVTGAGDKKKSDVYKNALHTVANNDVDIFENKFVNYLCVYLDSGANVSIIHPHLLSNVRPADISVTAVGINGDSIILDRVGDLDKFNMTVYASDMVSGNILSYAELAQHNSITYWFLR